MTDRLRFRHEVDTNSPEEIPRQSYDDSTMTPQFPMKFKKFKLFLHVTEFCVLENSADVKLTAQGTAEVFCFASVIACLPVWNLPLRNRSVMSVLIPFHSCKKSRSVWQAPCLVLVAIFGSALSLSLIGASKKLKVSNMAWKEAQRKDAVLASASFLPPQGPAMPVQANHFETFLPPQGPAMPVQANHFEAFLPPQGPAMPVEANHFEVKATGGIKNPFLEHLRIIWAQKKYPPITDADGGSYQQCHRDGPLVWVYFWGHLRTFGMHAQNLQSFLDGAEEKPCMFLVIYTRDEFDHPGRHPG